nr:ATP-dependent DNA helicase PcrA [Lachnospiraceae bacterium]
TRLENLEELINKAVSFEEEHSAQQAGPEALSPQELLSLFLEEISLVSDIDRTNDSDDVLTMMTLHAAKGLEFDVIYLCGMEEGLFPSSASINAEDPEAEIEEERRLCYVGFTRARKKLNLSAARERMVNGETRYMKPSRFIDEIPEDAAEKHFVREHRSYENRKQSFSNFGGYEGRMDYELGHGSFGGGFSGDSAYRAYNSYNERPVSEFGGRKFGSLDTTPAGKPKKRGAAGLSSVPGLTKGFGGAAVKQKPEYEAGDRVKHVKFGAGTVAEIQEDVKDYKVTVDFDESGRKVMYAGFAKLIRI